MSSRDYYVFLAGILVVLLPLAAVYTIKKLKLLEIHPDQEIVYKIVDGQELSLHAFFSKLSEEKPSSPALVFFHGGRWRFGSPAGFYPQCRFFTAHGYHCFSVQYRLGSVEQTDVRKAVADAQSALAYLFEHAGELRIDPDRIAVGGGSSGGHLAATLGVAVNTVTNPPTIPRARPAALILYNPMLDLSPCTPDHHLVKDYWQEISPLHHVDAMVPPALILAGTDDPEVPVKTTEAFCQAVREHKGRCDLALYEGQSHGFFNYRRENKEHFHKTNSRILAFLKDLWN